MNNDKNALDKISKFNSDLTPVGRKRALPSDIYLSDVEEEEKKPHPKEYLEVLFRRKWILIIFFLTVVLTAVTITFLTTPTYRATATIHIKKETPDVLTFKDIYQKGKLEEDYYQTQYEVLKSKTLAKRVISKLSLENSAEFNHKSLLSSIKSSAIKKMKELLGIEKDPASNMRKESKTVNAFKDRLEVSPVKLSQLVKLTFNATNPDMAANVTNTMAEEFINFSRESKIEPTRQARIRLEKEVEAIKVKLESSEKQLNEYIARSQLIMLNKDAPESLLTQKLENLSRELDEAIKDRITKEAIYKEVKKSGGNYNSVLENHLIQSLTLEYAKLESQYFNLLKIHKPEYPKMLQLEKQIDNIKGRIEVEERRIIETLGSDFNIAVKKEMFLSTAIQKLRQDVLNYQQKMVHYQILKREVEANRKLYNDLNQRHKEIGVGETLSNSNIQILDRADVPLKPYKPKIAMNLLLSIILGLFGGVCLVIFVEYFDSTIKTANDIEKKSKVPLIGAVPVLRTESKKLIGDAPNTHGHFTEALRSISTFIQLTNGRKAPKIILVTSPLPRDGKSLFSTNIAKHFINFNGKGIVVDADMRRPSTHEILELDNAIGLSSYLSGTAGLDAVIKKSPHPRYDIITAGPPPANPSELLNSAHMKELINSLSSRYSFIVIDSPPVLGLSDGLILSQFAEAVLVVVKSATTPRDALVQTMKLLNGVSAHVLGVVLNGINTISRYGYESYYSSYHEVNQ